MVSGLTPRASASACNARARPGSVGRHEDWAVPAARWVFQPASGERTALFPWDVPREQMPVVQRFQTPLVAESRIVVAAEDRVVAFAS